MSSIPSRATASPPLPPRPPVPEIVWAPLAAAMIVLTAGAIGTAVGLPLLVASLGSTALLQAHRPDDESAKPYNIVVSHLVGLGSAFVAVLLFGIPFAPSVFEVGQLSWARIGACTVAIALASTLELLLGASHAPAASTTLLAALGSFQPTRRDSATVALGVLTVALVGELVRRARLRTRGHAGASG